jgi:hypothetical protein
VAIVLDLWAAVCQNCKVISVPIVESLPMDIAALTTFLSSFLPFLRRLEVLTTPEKMAVAAKFGEDDWNKAKTIWFLLLCKLEASKDVKVLIELVAAKPESKARKAVLREELEELFKENPDLAEMIARIMQKKDQDGSTQVSGHIASQPRVSATPVIASASGGISGAALSFNSSGSTSPMPLVEPMTSLAQEEEDEFISPPFVSCRPTAPTARGFASGGISGAALSFNSSGSTSPMPLVEPMTSLAQEEEDEFISPPLVPCRSTAPPAMRSSAGGISGAALSFNSSGSTSPMPFFESMKGLAQEEEDEFIIPDGMRVSMNGAMNGGGSFPQSYPTNIGNVPEISTSINVHKKNVIQLQEQLKSVCRIQESPPPSNSSSSVVTRKDLVDCTVFSSPTATCGDMFLVQVFVHLPEQAEVAKQYAQQFDSDAKQLGVRSLGIPIERGTELTFYLSIPKFEVDDPIQQLVWNGSADSVQFGVTAPSELTQKTVIGTVTVSRNSIPLGYLKFKLSITPAASSTSKELQPVGEAARLYKKAFVSYCSKDRNEVLKRVQGLAVTGIEVFQDVLNLEPGERWEKELYHHIDKCDLFLLFWSTSAKQSKWVLKEVLYALERQGKDELNSPEIIPVIIEGPPIVSPPEELQHLHFNDKLLYFMAASKV